MCGHQNPQGLGWCGACGWKIVVAAELEVPNEQVLLGGRFEVRGLLGDGQRKQVLLAVDHRLGREVALAVVRWSSLTINERARVELEIQLVAALGVYANIVTLHDVVQLDGSIGLVFEHLPGGSLRDLLDSVAPRGLPVRDVLRIGAQIAHGLDAVHRAGVLFRDLKPDNVLLAGDGTVKLGDFGLAVRRGSEQRLTGEGVVGTFAYLAPERVRRGHIDHRVDLYSLGVVLYELLVGEPPFPGSDPDEVAAQHLRAVPPPVAERRPETPAGLADLVHQLLEKEMGGRPAEAALVAAQLELLLSELSPRRAAGV
jgi:serine/threonine protein kinase